MEKRGVIHPNWTPPESKEKAAEYDKSKNLDKLKDHVTKRAADEVIKQKNKK